jgi:amino-acid N-acetyltransferase
MDPNTDKNIDPGSYLHAAATLYDVASIKELIAPFAAADIMLPRTETELFENIREYHVCKSNGSVVGCAALHIMSPQMAELRALAVHPAHQSHGIGSDLVQHCLDEARRLGIPNVFTLTLEEKFFTRHDFIPVPRESLTQKVWSECYKCPKYDRCDETAMLYRV